MTALLEPPITDPLRLDADLRRDGRAVLSPAGLCELLEVAPAQLDALRPYWSDLPPDAYLRDGGRYRRRRHACFVVDGEAVTPVAGRPHWQPVEYNALHGGLERWFEPMADEMVAQPVWSRLLVALGAHGSRLRAPTARGGAEPSPRGSPRNPKRPGVSSKLERPWYVEAHQFRIDTTDGIGRPTPEGAHRDGVDVVAVLLVDRVGIKGGETRVFDAEGPAGLRFTMTAPWTTLVLDDERVIHESTPIQPTGEAGHRDTLVLTFRAGGFQGPTASA